MDRSKEALRLLQELTSKDPDARSFNLLGHVAESAGEIDLSIQSYRKAAKLRPDDEDNYLDYSTLCMNYKNFSLALEIVDADLAIIPHSYRLRVQKGAILAELGRVIESKETLRFAMKLQEDHREALLGLARTQAHSNEFDDAAKTLAEGVEKFPQDYYMQYYYGFVLLEVARKDTALEFLGKAKRALARAVELNPTFAKSYFLLGKIYLNEDSKVAAVQFETCLRLDPDYAPAKYQLGRLYLKIGRRREGEDLLSQVKDQTAQQLEDDSKPRIQVVKQ
jgi:tetratricopeptide (TPR) repeat protein